MHVPSELMVGRLSRDERIAIASYAARASWPEGFQIYERGATADGVFVVVSGCVVLRSRVRAGRGFVPWVATVGETFGAEGLATNAVYATDARADEETETLYLSTTKLRAFVREQPSQALSLIGQVMGERVSLLEKLRELTTLSVEQRLLASLRRMATHVGFLDPKGRIELSSSRYRLLCELVGATRESVSLVLGRLTGEGLAERVGSTLYVQPSQRLFDRLSGGAEASLLRQSLAQALGEKSAAPVELQ
ncbi:MAG: Crp/Fnr family transcriptional regulator [Gemmatimonadota bacterium]|nr:Crp/Fnr family transcriptional regulator [Gemmatimonadota bacterium]